MEGRTINQESIQSCAERYIFEYVICKECNGSNTLLVKKPETRILEMKCDSCQSSRSVIPIKSATAVNAKRK